VRLNNFYPAHFFTLLLTCVAAQAGATEEAVPYSRYVNQDFPRNLYWGDTHLHTQLSSDAYGFGGELTPEDAYALARENTREALFDAMQCREVYASTGPRMVVRFFGGWTFGDMDHRRPDYAAIGYHYGVPMGGGLSGAPAGGAPKFLVAAFKDPEGANLDRVQIVKGWLDAAGRTHEKVYDVALPDRRDAAQTAEGAHRPKSTVDQANATYTNTVGAVALSTVWTDPQFSPDESAFYYLRVLEIPTPRWTTYDAAFYGTAVPDTVPAEIQERAYTSPIWYTPG